MSICDKDCLNCPFPDCICEQFDEEDLEMIEHLVEILTSPEKSKKAEKKRSYYERHKEERRAYQRAYYAANKEACAVRRRDYYEKNREKVLAQVKEYRNKHYDRLKLSAKKRYWAKVAAQK